MKCTIITGHSGSGKTGILLDKLSREKDNLVVTTDPAVIYIEMYMARNNIPGRCIGINSLAKIIAQDTNMPILNETTREVEMAIIGKIINSLNLESFKENNYNNGLINKIHSFITECKESNICIEDLEKVSKEVSLGFEAKLKDIILIYKEYNKILKEKQMYTKEDLVRYVTNSLIDKTLSYANVYIDTLDRYNNNTIELIESIIPICNEMFIVFNTTSKKAYDYDIYQEGMKAMIKVYDFIDTLPYCPVERIESTSKKDTSNGLSIIEKEMFNKDTVTKSNSDNVVLHQASTLYKEVDFMISKINELVKNGAKYSEIIVTSSTMDRYINIISATMRKNNIPYFYFKNTTIEKTFLYEFLYNIIDIKINDLNVNNLLNLCHLNFFNLTPSEIVSIDTFYNRFGDDLIIALDNGKKYDANNTLIVQSIIKKIMIPINKITDSPSNVNEFLSSIYNYLEEINIKDIIIEKALMAEKEGFIHSSKETINTWNDIMSLLTNMSNIFGNDHLEIEEIKEIFSKMASEKLTNNSELYHGQLTLLDIDNAQNRKSKYLFVIGCNEGYMPKPASVQIINDREKIIINSIINKDLRLSSVYQNYKNAAIYNTLILPQEKLFLSWSNNDIDFKPLRYASIINNIVKTFEDNIIKEEDFYNNDDEEKFINLLKNISLYRYKGIEKNTDDFMYFVSNPKYNNRLIKALNKLNNEETSFNAENVLDGYKEKEYFSVTRIERYNECPFKHYVNFALKPEKNKVFEETAADKGTYYHHIFKLFFDKCMYNEISIDISYDDYLTILEDIFIKEDEHNENFFNSNCKNRYLSYTMKEKIKTSLWNALLQLRSGNYKVIANEYNIGKNISLDIDVDGNIYNLTGTVDRVDATEDYSRIIDYKSGDTEFSKDRLEAGIQLQLPLYSKAISRDSDISGMYYFRIKDFVKDIDDDSSPLKEYKLSGPTLNNTDVLKDNDTKLDSGITSDIISASMTLKGEISSRSKLLSKEEMESTMNMAVDIAGNSIKEILSGNTKAHPLIVKDYDACKYCKYKCLCNIDKTVKDSVRKVTGESL